MLFNAFFLGAKRFNALTNAVSVIFLLPIAVLLFAFRVSVSILFKFVSCGQHCNTHTCTIQQQFIGQSKMGGSVTRAQKLSFSPFQCCVVQMLRFCCLSGLLIELCRGYQKSHNLLQHCFPERSVSTHRLQRFTGIVGIVGHLRMGSSFRINFFIHMPYIGIPCCLDGQTSCLSSGVIFQRIRFLRGIHLHRKARYAQGVQMGLSCFVFMCVRIRIALERSPYWSGHLSFQ